MISGFHLEQLLRLKLSIDKGKAISNACVTFSHELAIAVWSGPCALTPQLQILVDKVLLVMIENRLGKNLLCLACSQCCGRTITHVFKHVLWSIMWVHRWLIQFQLQSGYKMMTASFIQHMPVLKSL